MYSKLADYGLIGNCRSAALVSKYGSVDWLSLPDFDSPALFCKLLDDKKGGYFDVHPLGFYQSSQFYKKNTNILKTDFFNHSGRVLLTDFMPISKEAENTNAIPEYGLKMVRRIKSKEGDHRINVQLAPTPNFAQAKATVEPVADGAIFHMGETILRLYTDKPFSLKKDSISAEFDIKKGEEVFFALGYYKKETKLPKFDFKNLRKLYFQTLDFWLWWIGLCRYDGVFRGSVVRSALTLKMLIYSPTGAVVAAPTTSLPEKIGGSLNWDYRFVWLRDASFTMYALLGLGYLKEALDFMGWIEKIALAEKTDLQIMYGLRGEKILTEKELRNLSGYEHSRPVRIGNEAFKQKQFDVFGEVLTCVNLFVNSGGKLSSGMQQFVVELVEFCLKSWQEKDAGIWEPRYGYQHHTYSKLMCWVGVDRGLRIARRSKMQVDFPRWEVAEEEIKKDILENGYDESLGAFVESYGSRVVDSSLLNIPLVGFLGASDPRVESSLRVTLADLTKDWFIYRTSDKNDPYKAGEGAFFLSTFWLVDTLSVLGRTKEAKIWLEKLIYYATPLGLYAEMFDPKVKEHLGNFPQAFTHLGLINSILNLNAASKLGAEAKPTTPTERLKKVLGVLNISLEDAFEFFIPSRIRETLDPRERRRTRQHSLLGKIYHKVWHRE